MSHFDRSKRFDHDLRVARLEAAEHVDVVREPQLGVQTAHDVELARRIVARGIRLDEHFLQAARVRAVFFGHPGERTEHAGIAKNADVGRIDVLICGKIDSMAVTPSVGEVGEVAEGEKVVRCEKREAILARESLAPFHFSGNGDQRRVSHATFRTASVTL